MLVLHNAGPLGGPGMPEWGMLPIPKKLLKQGVRDMVRISDARMSGTSYGCCVLHVAPESFIGGPLALVQDGDSIELDVPARRLQLNVSEDELNRRRAAWKPAPPKLVIEQVLACQIAKLLLVDANGGRGDLLVVADHDDPGREVLQERCFAPACDASSTITTSNMSGSIRSWSAIRYTGMIHTGTDGRHRTMASRSSARRCSRY